MRRSEPKEDMMPHWRSAQSLGRKRLPAFVTPRITKLRMGWADILGPGRETRLQSEAAKRGRKTRLKIAANGVGGTDLMPCNSGAGV